jgi:hypothetical protein
MCGYCIESLMVEKFVEARLSDTQIEIDDLFLPQYLQDYEDFEWTIKNKEFSVQYLSDISDELVDIFFCRLYDQFLFNGHDGELFNYLLTIIGGEQADQFLIERQQCHDQDFLNQTLSFLSIPDFYQDKQIWDLFTENNATLTSIAAECLRRYIDWWLMGKGREKDQDGFRRIEETGIYDPIMNTPQKEWDKFNSILPGVYFSLAFLSRTRSHLDIIKSIALTCPDGTPNFFGNDLWLQRRAFWACVKAYGIDFIVANIHLIRPPLICHTVLIIDFPPDEFERLYLAVLFERERTGDEDAYEGIMRLGNLMLGD